METQKVCSACIVEVCHCQQYKMTFAALLPATIRYSYVCLGAVALLLVGSPMLDRSKVMAQTKRDTLALQVGGWA
jgi:hypothetical protein